MTPEDLYALGVAVIPLAWASKQPLVKWARYQTEQPTPADLARWFRSGSAYNAAAVCGHSGFTVLDFDRMEGYEEWMKWATKVDDIYVNPTATCAERVEPYTVRPKADLVAHLTYRVETAKGMHVYLWIDDAPRCGKMWRSATARNAFHRAREYDATLAMETAPGFWGDVKGRGGYVLIPPSVHPSGVPYLPVNPGAPIVRVPSLDAVLPDPPRPPAPPPTPAPLLAVPDTHGLYPLSSIERIKSAVPITRLFPGDASGGRWFMTRCPWHQSASNRDSLSVDTVSNVVRCFSGCTGTGVWDVIEAYKRLHNVSNREAIKTLSALV